eukprot:1159735-Pelagomonas_calceolata.AAC.10
MHLWRYAVLGAVEMACCADTHHANYLTDCQGAFPNMRRACPPTLLPSMQIRQSAGLLLKNNLGQQFAGTPDELKQSIKVVAWQRTWEALMGCKLPYLKSRHVA